jgi:hypothetical protein
MVIVPLPYVAAGCCDRVTLHHLIADREGTASAFRLMSGEGRGNASSWEMASNIYFLVEIFTLVSIYLYYSFARWGMEGG